MPPNRHRRKKAKKNGLHRTNFVADDDDVFEADDKPIKKYKASKAVRQNLRSGDKSSETSNIINKKHVNLKRRMSSTTTELENKSTPVVIPTDSDQSDIEMDIGPPSQKHCTKSKDADAGEPHAKRQKLCDESSSEKDVISEKTTPSAPDEPAEKSDTNAKTTEDNAANSQQIPDNESEDLDYELAIEESDILLDLDEKEASGSGTTGETTEVTATEKEIEPTAEVENEAEVETENEPEDRNETEDQNVAEPQTEDAHTENAATDKELNEECEDDAAEDDVAELLVDDYDTDFGEDEDAAKSPMVSRVPKWKRAAMEKGKSAEARTIESKKSGPENLTRPMVLNRITSTVTSAKAPVKGPTTTTMAAAETASTATSKKSDKPFKIPLQVQTSTRDPRLVKTVTNDNSNAATNKAQAAQQSNQVASSSNANTGERKSVKDRLGTPFQSQGLFSNIKNTTSYVIQSNMRLTAAESASVADRVNQPISSIPMSMIKPISGNVNRPNFMQPPPSVGRPIPPAFARKSQSQETELILPSFATGAQKYEPVFTHLFRTTCRYFMRDSCNKPDCQLEHRMPDHAFFRSEIDKMFQSSIIDLYTWYMCANQKLFDFYFDDFCQYFGKNNLVDNLKQMAEDCAERKVPFHFSSVIEGLMLTGQSFAKALATLIPSVQTVRSIKTSKEILKLILNPRIGNIDPFVGVINSIRKANQFKFLNEWINRLLIIHSQKKTVNVELNDVIFELINGVSLEKSAKALDQELMMKFIESLGKSPQETTQ